MSQSPPVEDNHEQLRVYIMLIAVLCNTVLDNLEVLYNFLIHSNP